MMKKAIAGLAVASSMAMGSFGALADGGPRASIKDSPPPFSWTGFYIGGHLGWHRTDDGSYLVAPNDAATIAFWNTACVTGGSCNPNHGGAKGDGAIGGLQAGYNWQMSNWLIGVEADISGSTSGATHFNQELNTALVGPSNSWRSIATTNVEWVSTVRGRLGVLLSPTFLAYITGGLAVAGVERDWSQAYTNGNGSFNGTTYGRSKTTETGFALGAGAEWALGHKVTLGAEYLYVGLGSQRFGATFVTGGVSSITNSNFTVRGGDIDNHIARLKVNFKM